MPNNIGRKTQEGYDLKGFKRDRWESGEDRGTASAKCAG